MLSDFRPVYAKAAARALFVISLAAVVPIVHATPFVGGGPDLKKFCNGSSPRSTIVYIDSRAMSKAGSLQWAKSLINQLKVDMAPHEPLSIVALDTVHAASDEIDSFCYPGLWPSEPRDAGGWFSHSSKDQLKSGRKTFGTRLAIALEKAIKRYKAPSHPKNVDLIRALASDTSRYARDENVVRLVIYSDFSERSSLIDVSNKPTKADAERIEKQIRANFHNAIVYGVNSATNTSPGDRNAINAFFSEFFRGADALPAHLSSSLVLPSTPPGPLHVKMRIHGQWKGRGLNGTARLITDKDGQLQDSYVTFVNQGGALLEGHLDCDDTTCKLRAKTQSKTLTDEAGETVELKGQRDALGGMLGWPDSKTPQGDAAVIHLKAKVVVNNKRDES